MVFKFPFQNKIKCLDYVTIKMEEGKDYLRITESKKRILKIETEEKGLKITKESDESYLIENTSKTQIFSKFFIFFNQNSFQSYHLFSSDHNLSTHQYYLPFYDSFETLLLPCQYSLDLLIKVGKFIKKASKSGDVKNFFILYLFTWKYDRKNCTKKQSYISTSCKIEIQ